MTGIGVAATSLAFSILAAEIITRAVVRTAPPFDYMPFFRVRQDDPDTGWRYPGGLEFAGENEDGEHVTAVASDEGFFTPDEPAPEHEQIIVLGDSFLAAFHQAQRPVAVALRDALDVPVYNLAAAGWGPESYRGAYERYAAEREHEIVVVFTFLNDIPDVRNWQAWQQSGDASFATWIYEHRPQLIDANFGTTWLDRHSILWNWGKYRLREMSRETPDLGLERVAPPDGPAFDLHLSRGYPFMEHDPSGFVPRGDYFPPVAGYLASIDRLRDAIGQRGARMFLVWIPTKERVHLPLLAPDRFRSYVTNETGAIDGLEKVLAFYAERSRVPFLDLTPALEARARRGEQLYFTVDPHFNSRGNEVVGSLVADFLRATASKWSPPRSAAHGDRQRSSP
jgi:hypothetical protein